MVLVFGICESVNFTHHFSLDTKDFLYYFQSQNRGTCYPFFETFLKILCRIKVFQ